MRCCIICDKGFEELVAKELEKSFSVTQLEIHETNILFSINDAKYIEELAKISYIFQSAIKVLSHVLTFDAKDQKSTFDKIKNALTTEYEKEIIQLSSLPLQVKCIRKGYHEFKSTDISSFVARECFSDKKEKDFKSDFSYFIYINEEKGYMGLDFSGRDLHKRDYKIFLGSQALRSTVAFNTLLFANASKKEIIVDPFMGSGTIPIEAGLWFSNTSPFFFTKEKFSFTKIFTNEDWETFFSKIDKKKVSDQFFVYGYDSLLKFLKHSQKNAKIADVNKNINLSMCSVNWLDTKIDKHSVDKIITQPPMISENGSLTKIINLYKEFFDICDFLLKKKGEITILTTHKSLEKMKDIAQSKSFKIVQELDVYEGLQEFVLAKFIR